ncbi:MAG TPA: VOC family protein [Thermodesulfobacteriota bacterium]
MPTFSGVSHVVLTVRDLETSTRWYRDVLGLTSTGGHPGVSFLLHPESKLLFVLVQHERSDGKPFDETRVGLDHLAFLVSGRAELEAWKRTFEERGVTHSPIATESYGQVLVFRDPDNIQLEFFANPGT